MTLYSPARFALAVIALMSALGFSKPSAALTGSLPAAAIATTGTTHLIGKLSGAHPASESTYPFEGTWDCDGSMVRLTGESYRFGGQRALDILDVTQISENGYGLTFPGNYRLGFFGITATQMEWHSPGSGDSFFCTRISPEEPAVPATGAADTGKAIEGQFGFEGEWTCYDSPSNRGAAERHPTGTLIMSESEAAMASLGLKGRYQTVSAIGKNGTAYSLMIDAGYPLLVGIYELSPGSMLVNSSGLMLECER